MVYQVYQVYRVLNISHDNKQKEIVVVRVCIRVNSLWYTTQFPIKPINKGFSVNQSVLKMEVLKIWTNIL